MSSPFPERYILDGFRSIERSLEEVLRYVPYCAAHESVWSPVQAECIIDACLQLDSLWKATARMSPCVDSNKNLDITNYYEFFGKPSGGSSVHGRWVVLRVEQPTQIRPFETWDSPTEYQPLPWWRAYTDLKHDRWRHVERATLGEAVSAVAALFLAIVRCEYCGSAVGEAGWLSGKPTWESLGHHYNAAAWLSEDSGGTKNMFVAAESALFSYPVGWCLEKITASDKWKGNSTLRFREWFDNHVT